MVPYRYSPLNESLNEIRLLELHPGDFSADLHVSISKATLILEAPPVHEAMAGPPIYEALSYVWGMGIEKGNSAHILKLLSQLGSESEVDYRLLALSPA